MRQETRIILHIDMNAFFASVEQSANPDLRNKPVAVTGRGERSIILTASYEARIRGVKTGMAIWEARRCCPELIIVIGDNRKYTHTSREIIRMMRDYTPMVEVFSIDEAWLDVTHSLSIFGSAERIAWLLKARIRHAFGLTCSVGIAPNKLLAKLASEMQKPDGLTVITPENVPKIMEPLPVGALCGIGRKSARQLALMGINTCGELGRCDVGRLNRRFGVVGRRLKDMGQGIDESPVVPEDEAEEVKSVGHSMTLDRDLTERAEIHRYLLQLSEMVGRRARRYGVLGKTVTLSIRFADFYSGFSRQETLGRAINLSDEIYRAAVALLDSVELAQAVRLLGVRLTGLQQCPAQLPLFPDERRMALAAGAMDLVNDRFGEFTVTYGALLDAGNKGSGVISPAWRPEGIRNIPVT